MLRRKIAKFLQGEEAATAVEYAILLTVVVLAISQSVVFLGTSAQDVFDAIAAALP